jgi:GNAT superfamily N-acetyltransferase
VTALSSIGTSLVDTDRRYFEFGASVVEMGGATVASMAGLEELAGACVVQRVDPQVVAADPQRWVATTTDHLRALGCSTARIYLMEPHTAIDEALTDAGFRARLEVGYASRTVITGVRSDVALAPIADERGWETKRKLHAGSEKAADGHRAPADDWVDLERRKCGATAMRAFLITVDGEVCGAVATIDGGSVLRGKNLFVHPHRWRQGIASAVMGVLSRLAQDEGKEAVGIFGVPGNVGDAVYRRLSMDPAVSQFEWSMALKAR